MANIILLMGGPGSGKGTQAKKLCEKNPNFLHVSTGDLLRNLIQKGTDPRIPTFQSYIQRGELLPDHYIVELLSEFLSKQDKKKTILLDGYPRTAEQAISFKQHFGSPKAIIHLDMPKEILQERLLNRHEGRLDDQIDVIVKRIELFEKDTLPVIQDLKQQYPTITLNAPDSIEHTHESLMSQLPQLLERVQPLSLFSFMQQYWKTHSIYRISETVATEKQASNFSVGLGPWKFAYFLQTHDAVKKVLSARTRFGTVYHQFSKSADLQYDFVATDSGNGELLENGQINFWHLAHHGFKQATQGDAQRIPRLIDKHFKLFFKEEKFALDQAFENFFYTFWSDYLFGGSVDAKDYMCTREQILSIMRFSFYENRFKSIDPYNLSSPIWSLFKKSDLAQAKLALKHYIEMASSDSWVARFRQYLERQNHEHTLNLTKDIIEHIIADNVFDLFFEPDFLEGVLYESLVEIVQKQLDLSLPEHQDIAYRAGMERAYLFPYRSRIVEEPVSLPDDTVIPANTLVFINLKASGWYHSFGARSCVGQAFSRYVKDRLFTHLADIQWKVESISTPATRLALAGDDDVPVSPERYEVSWSLKRESLQSKIPYHTYNGQRFYDVLAIDEHPVERELIVKQLIFNIQTKIQQVHLSAQDIVIAAPEVRGLPIASMVAEHLDVPLITIRKSGGYKMPETAVKRISYQKGYGQADIVELPLSKAPLIQGKQVIFIDDGLASGESAAACCDLVQQLGGSVLLILAMIKHQYVETTPVLLTPAYEGKIKTLFDFKALPLLEAENNSAHHSPCARLA